MVFMYDASGSPIGFMYRYDSYAVNEWIIYWYEKNLQGDIVAIYDSEGTLCISYIYDAWGNCRASYESGYITSVARLNPFRYRGYYYDDDLKLYYLKSRYYDPNTCRFINTDSALYHSMLGYNMFAYCGNNPVNYYDPTGEYSEALNPSWPATIWLALLALIDGPLPIGEILGVAIGTLIVADALRMAQSKASEKPENKTDDSPDSATESKTPPPDVVVPDVEYPGDDPTVAPDGYEWTGPDPQGGKRGGYKNTDPGKRDSWHPDLDHPGDIDPHWDYNDMFGHKWRVFPDGIEFVK